MTPERWQQVKELFEAAQERAPEERAAFINQAGAGDEVVRQELESLLAAQEGAASFMNTPAAQLVFGEELKLSGGQQFGHYEVIALLGEGGMGEVYLAQDTRLERKVALKLIQSSLTNDNDRVRRFRQEARAASALNHPNILTIYEIGLVEGRHFMAAEFVAGETLRARLERGCEGLGAVIDIIIQVASALAAAHEAGIIHRDVKPENVMVRPDGYVKVLDFGLAKLINQPSTSGEEGITIIKTQTGMVMGTASYMSPEQSQGSSHVDHRTDIWSLGVVLYEMITEHLPFEGKDIYRQIIAIQEIDPPPLSRFAANVPKRLEEIVQKSLAKPLDERYQAAKDLLTDLRSLKKKLEVYAETERTASPELRRTTDYAESLNGHAVSTSDTAASSSAVEGAPAISSAEYIMGGIRQHQSVALALVAALLIAATTLGYFYFMRSRKSAVNSTPAVKYETSPAYDSYVRAIVNIKSENPADVENAIRLLKQAIAADPGFAPAYAELARAYNIKAFYFALESEKKQLNEDAAVAVEKALALDPNLAEAHFARGLILWTHANRFPHEQAIQAYRRALELNPNLDEAHHQLGVVYFHIGLLDKGRSELEKAVAINPGNALARFRFGAISLYKGKYEEAYKIFKGTPLEKNPSLWAFQMATALFRLGRTQEASDIMEKFLKDYPKDEGGGVTSVKAMILAKAGKASEAKAAIQRANELGNGYGHFHHTAYNIASAYALLNETEPATKWLQIAADDGFPCYPLFEQDTNLDNLRRDAHFIAFMKEQRQQWEYYQATL